MEARAVSMAAMWRRALALALVLSLSWVSSGSGDSASDWQQQGEALRDSATTDGVPQLVPQGVFTNHSAAGYVSFSTFRVSPTRFVVAGLGLVSGLTVGAPGSSAPLSSLLSCSWTSRGTGASALGKLGYFVMGESHSTHADPLAYEVAVLICDLRAPSAGEGFLSIALGATVFIPYHEPVPLKVLAEDSQGPFLRELVFCGPPLHPSTEMRSVAQWMDYHLYYIGFDHLFLFEIAGARYPDLQRFLDAGVLSFVDFVDQRLYPSWYHGQSLAMHHCLYQNRETAAWVAYGDLDEYLEAPFSPPQPLKFFLRDLLHRTPPTAYVSRGCYHYYAVCEEPLWGPEQPKYAVELLPYRPPEAFCQRTKNTPAADAPADLCPDAFGRRKAIVNPRMVSLVKIHKVLRLFDHRLRVEQHGVDLPVSTGLRHGHFRGVSQPGQWCRKPLRGEMQRHLAQGSIVEDRGVARIAERARECAAILGVPTWECSKK